ncbi:MAG: DUF5007 domain-containing protein [Arachidicoccus sp.]|nr:DUF5007 domain-containing protein [Arachidicoccus sp.]
MKNRIISILFYYVIFLCISCRKIENGYLSDSMRYINSTATIARGATSSNSDVINPDGSTAPLNYRYSNLVDSVGNPVSDSFFLYYPVMTWKDGQSYKWATDTTEELINSKRDSVNLQPISFNEKTGAWHANAASAFIPLGDYTFDIQATNIWGTKTYKKFGTLHVKDLDISDCWTLTSSSTYVAHYAISPYNTSAYTKPSNTAPTISLERTSPTGHILHVKVLDKNGVPFDPSIGEVRYYSKTSATYPSLEYYSKIHPVSYDDSAYNIDYYITPFPYSTSYTMYFYLVYSYSGDNSNIPAGSLYCIWGMKWQIIETGTYTMTVQFTNLMHK